MENKNETDNTSTTNSFKTITRRLMYRKDGHTHLNWMYHVLLNLIFKPDPIWYGYGEQEWFDKWRAYHRHIATTIARILVYIAIIGGTLFWIVAGIGGCISRENALKEQIIEEFVKTTNIELKTKPDQMIVYEVRWCIDRNLKYYILDLNKNGPVVLCEVIIDGCEYLTRPSTGDNHDDLYTHKGNCKNPIHKKGLQ